MATFVLDIAKNIVKDKVIDAYEKGLDEAIKYYQAQIDEKNAPTIAS